MIFRDVKGRREGEKIYFEDGDFVTTTVLNMHSDLYDKLNGMQLYQDKPGWLEVRVVPDSGFTDRDASRIQKEVERKLGQDMRISLAKVDELEYTENRKFKLLIQKIQAR